jgi:hypothetical protein
MSQSEFKQIRSLENVAQIVLDGGKRILGIAHALS